LRKPRSVLLNEAFAADVAACSPGLPQKRSAPATPTPSSDHCADEPPGGKPGKLIWFIFRVCG